jgi:4-hydroxybenzoyl-CoA reductase subunit beta
MGSMILPEFEHFEPVTLSEACSLLKDYDGRARVVAGGSDLFVQMGRGLVEPEFVIDLKAIPELKRLEYDATRGLIVGATCTLTTLIRSSRVREKAPLLVEAAKTVAARPLQNMGTIGGNVCLDTRCVYYDQSRSWRSSRPACLKAGGSVCHVVKGDRICYSVFQADAACALYCLNARVTLVEEGGERTLALSDFYTGRGESPNALKPTEILKEIVIPTVEGLRGGYEKLSPRAALDFPQVGVAGAMTFDSGDRVRGGKIVLNGLASRPVEVEPILNLLMGNRLEDKLIEEAGRKAMEAAHPVNNTGVSPHYRKKMAGVLTRRILERFSRAKR